MALLAQRRLQGAQAVAAAVAVTISTAVAFVVAAGQDLITLLS